MSELINYYGSADGPFSQRCGLNMFDDYVETRPGAAGELERWLNNSYASKRPTAAGGPNSSNYPIYQNSNLQSQQTTPGAVSSGFPSPVGIPPYQPQIQQGTQTPTIINCEPENRWLLICTSMKKRPLGLDHLNACVISSDLQLYKEIKSLYSGLRDRWARFLSLKRVIGIRFVQASATLTRHVHRMINCVCAV